MKVEEDLDKLQNLPFPPLLPITLDVQNLSIRDIPGKRKTLRYFVELNNKTFRIKEFFMDWFYTGFPKSIMKSLMSLYWTAEVHEEDGLIWYYSKNYKGNDSVSLYLNGTTVEIECYEPALPNEFGSIIHDFNRERYLTGRFIWMGFARRSFLAEHRDSSWWEDERISSISWNDVNVEDVFRLGSSALRPKTDGYRKGDDGSVLDVLILSEPYFRKVVWIETIDEWSNIPQGIYKFRNETGLFDTIIGEEANVFHRSPLGPSVIRYTDKGVVATISFSPGFDLSDVEWTAGNIDGILGRKAEVLAAIRKRSS